MDLKFFCRMEQKAEHFCLTVWGPPECEEEGDWILCQVSKQTKNTGRNQSCQAGEEEALQLALYFLPVLWLVLSEGGRALPGAAFASRLLHHSLQSAGGGAVIGIPVSNPLFPEPDCPAAFPLNSCSCTSPGLDLLSSTACWWICCRRKERGSWLPHA